MPHRVQTSLCPLCDVYLIAVRTRFEIKIVESISHPGPKHVHTGLCHTFFNMVARHCLYLFGLSCWGIGLVDVCLTIETAAKSYKYERKGVYGDFQRESVTGSIPVQPVTGAWWPQKVTMG